MTELTQNLMVKDLLVPEQDSELTEASIVILIDSKEDEVFVIGLGDKTKPNAMSYRLLLEELIEGKIKKGTFEKTEYWKKVEEGEELE